LIKNFATFFKFSIFISIIFSNFLFFYSFFYFYFLFFVFLYKKSFIFFINSIFNINPFSFFCFLLINAKNYSYFFTSLYRPILFLHHIIVKSHFPQIFPSYKYIVLQSGHKFDTSNLFSYTSCTQLIWSYL